MDYRERVNGAFSAAFYPVGISREALRTDVPGIEIRGITGFAVAKPEFFFFAFLTIEIRLRLRARRRNRRSRLLLRHLPLL